MMSTFRLLKTVYELSALQHQNASAEFILVTLAHNNAHREALVQSLLLLVYYYYRS